MCIITIETAIETPFKKVFEIRLERK